MNVRAVILLILCAITLSGMIASVHAWPVVLDAGVSEGLASQYPGSTGVGARQDVWPTGEWDREKTIATWISIPPGSHKDPGGGGHYDYLYRVLRPDGTVYKDNTFPQGFANDGYGVEDFTVSEFTWEPNWVGTWTVEFSFIDELTGTTIPARAVHFTLLPEPVTTQETAGISGVVVPAGSRAPARAGQTPATPLPAEIVVIAIILGSVLGGIGISRWR
jgi:hypothetical protein